MLEIIIKKQTKEGIELINKLVSDGVDTGRFINDFIEFCRKILLYKISGQAEEIAREIDEAVVLEINKLMAKLTEPQLSDIIKKFMEFKELFKQSYITQLPLEMVVVELTIDKCSIIKNKFEVSAQVQAADVKVVEKLGTSERIANLVAESVRKTEYHKRRVREIRWQGCP